MSPVAGEGHGATPSIELPAENDRRHPTWRWMAGGTLLSLALLAAALVGSGTTRSALAITGFAFTFGWVLHWIRERSRFRAGERSWQLAAASFVKEVGALHAAERALRVSEHPLAASIVAGRAESIAPATTERIVIALGVGQVRSRIRVTGASESPRQQELRRRAELLPDAARGIEITGPLGIAGAPLLVLAVARGYLIQLERLGVGTILVGAGVQSPVAVAADTEQPSWCGDGVTIHLAATVTELPAECRNVIEVRDPWHARLTSKFDDLPVLTPPHELTRPDEPTRRSDPTRQDEPTRPAESPGPELQPELISTPVLRQALERIRARESQHRLRHQWTSGLDEVERTIIRPRHRAFQGGGGGPRDG